MSEPRGPILVAVDFSDDSRRALLWACRESRAHDVDLVVLHVVHDPEAAPGYYDRSPEGSIRSLEETAGEMFGRWMAEVEEGHRVLVAGARNLSTRLVTGLPASRIVEVARESGAEHIVVGSRGRTGLERLLLGSKAQRVAQLADVPVTIVKDGTTSP